MASEHHRTVSLGADGLPDDFETFADTRLCTRCGDRVEPRYYVASHDLCMGCFWGDRR
ncbi:hypothetical protein [Halomicrobium katesii]|uniref:hypothetical protein n=1 Tax=Halomicrobium katesii TaxID=437163 RepID=UPI000367C39F|nr:hypothetical protein [Halomicrobium katesii]